MSGGGVGARLGGAPFCNPKTDRVEAAAPAKSERERVTSGVKQGLGVRRRGRCLLEKVQGTMEVAQGGGDCSLTRGSLSLTQGVLDDGRSPRTGDPPSPRQGESNPDPQRAFSPGRAQLTGGTRLAAAREGHPALPTPLQGSAQTEGLRAGRGAARRRQRRFGYKRCPPTCAACRRIVSLTPRQYRRAAACWCPSSAPTFAVRRSDVSRDGLEGSRNERTAPQTAWKPRRPLRWRRLPATLARSPGAPRSPSDLRAQQ